MMKIIIDYSSKWSNSFSDPNTKENIALSLGKIQESIRNEKVIIQEEDTYEDIMFKINQVFPKFQYNPITQNTVLGVLARLLGEIRYLSNVLPNEPDHIINKLKDKVDFKLFDRKINNEVIRISTPIKEIQNNGGGLIKNKSKDNLLLNKNEYSKLIYSVFLINNFEKLNEFIDVVKTASSLKELELFFMNNNLLYMGQYELHKFIELYNDNLNFFSSNEKEYRNFVKAKIEINQNIENYISIIKNLGFLNQNDETFHFQSSFINLAGILVYTITQFMIKIGLKDEIEGKLIEKKGNMKGIAPNSGGLTIKDFYSSFSDKKTSADTPYMISSKYFDKKACKNLNQSAFDLGITKEDGVLEINIDVEEDEALELKKIINMVGVSTFQLGKKGLAYIREIKTDE